MTGNACTRELPVFTADAGCPVCGAGWREPCRRRATPLRERVTLTIGSILAVVALAAAFVAPDSHLSWRFAVPATLFIGYALLSQHRRLRRALLWFVVGVVAWLVSVVAVFAAMVLLEVGW